MSGHLAKYCRNNQKCSYFSSLQHNYKECKENTNCVSSSHYNVRFSTRFDMKHDSRDNCCSVKEIEVNNFCARIDYGTNVNINLNCIKAALINFNHAKAANAQVNNDIINLNIDLIGLFDPYVTELGIVDFS